MVALIKQLHWFGQTYVGKELQPETLNHVDKFWPSCLPIEYLIVPTKKVVVEHVRCPLYGLSMAK